MVGKQYVRSVMFMIEKFKKPIVVVALAASTMYIGGFDSFPLLESNTKMAVMAVSVIALILYVFIEEQPEIIYRQPPTFPQQVKHTENRTETPPNKPKTVFEEFEEVAK